jgi:hypothetical protein
MAHFFLEDVDAVFTAVAVAALGQCGVAIRR